MQAQSLVHLDFNLIVLLILSFYSFILLYYLNGFLSIKDETDISQVVLGPVGNGLYSYHSRRMAQGSTTSSLVSYVRGVTGLLTCVLLVFLLRRQDLSA